MLGVVFIGGAAGGAARYAVTIDWPGPTSRFPSRSRTSPANRSIRTSTTRCSRLGCGAELRRTGIPVDGVDNVALRTGRLLGSLWKGVDALRVMRADMVRIMRDEAVLEIASHMPCFAS